MRRRPLATRARTWKFRLAAVLLSTLVLASIEGILRLLADDRASGLFVAALDSGKDRPYLAINREVGRRFFPRGHFVPRPTEDRLLAIKPERGFRVVAMGESTVAGFPYPNNLAFTRLLEHLLSRSLPERDVEVINLGIAAINSYALLDFVDEVLAVQPDLILVYAGHNEFYGALGAGSRVSLGNARWIVRSYLAAKDLQSFVLIRDALNAVRDALDPRPADQARTLMAQVVGERHIALDGSTFRAGEKQLRENLGAVLGAAKAAGVPVVLSELVSNVHDHAPFLADSEDAQGPARAAFLAARALEAQGEHAAARRKYYEAKDLDGMRFRAPESFNRIIHALARDVGCTVVPMQAVFEGASPHGLIGRELMLEHLHPNVTGQQLMAHAFFTTMLTHGLVPGLTATSGYRPPAGGPQFTELDTTVGHLRVKHLTSHWPFVPSWEPGRDLEAFVPENEVDALAVQVALDRESLPSAHVQLANLLLARGMEGAAWRELRALLDLAPLDVQGHLAVTHALVRAGHPERALSVLAEAVRIKGGKPPVSTADDTSDPASQVWRMLAQLKELAPRQPGIDQVQAVVRWTHRAEPSPRSRF